jgi:UDP-N-acetylmuramate--alanine ligase
VAIEGFGASFDVIRGGETLGSIRLPVPGRHSVYNGLAAIAVGLELDVPFRTIASALRRFRGVDRRFQRRGEAFGATVIDDYGHHPTEIAATLGAVREGFGARTVVVFQPHRYSRTQALLEEFGRAFYLADHVVVTDIYRAGETPIEGLDGAVVADALVRHGHRSAVHEPDLDKIPGMLRETVQPGDVVLTLGAGDVWKVGEGLVKLAKGERKGAGRSSGRRKPTGKKKKTKGARR